MNKILRTLFAALALGLALSGFAAVPTSAFLHASRAATVSVYDGRSSVSYELSTLSEGPAGSWYGEERIFIKDKMRLTSSLTGYLTSWHTYATPPTGLSEPGPLDMTKVLSETNLLMLTSEVISNLYPRFTTAATDFYVKFTPITYNIEYDLDGGSFLAGGSYPSTAKYDSPFTVSALTKNFYTFKGWRVGGKTYFNGVSNDVTFVNLTSVNGATVNIGALWQANKYPLQLSLGEGVAKIHYKTSASGDWQVTEKPLTVQVDYGETWSAWAEAKYGWEGSGTGWDPEGVTSGKMTETGDKFKPEATRKRFTVTAKPSPSDAGSVTGSGTYEYETQVELIATPAKGHSFTRWSDGEGGATRNLTVLCNTNLTANFVRNNYQLKLTVGEGVSNVWYRLGGTGDFTSVTDTRKVSVPYGTKYECYATAKYGYTVSGIGSSEENLWSGYMPDGDIAFVPTASKNVYRVQVDSTPAEAGSVSGAGRYEYLTLAYLTASPAAGYSFAGWSDGSTENPYWYAVVSNAALVATFKAKIYSLEITVGEGVSNVWYRTQIGDGDWSEWQSTDVSKKVEVVYGTRYQLYAEAKEGYVLTGSGSSRANPVTGTVRTDGASWEPKPAKQQYRLTLSAEPSTSGTVTGSGTYSYGDTAKLQAVPNAGYRFISWSDGSTETPHDVIVTCTTNLTATFGAKLCALEISLVEGVAKAYYRFQTNDVAWCDWISTDVSKTVDVAYGTRYQLYAEAKPGYVLSGTGSSAGSPVTGTMNADGFIFEPKPAKEQYRLTLSAEPSGAGTVSGSGTYSYGDTATLQAVPEKGYRFVSWSDGSAETPHLVTVTCATNLTARFAARACSLEISVGEGVAQAFYRFQTNDVAWCDWMSTDISTTVAAPYGTRYQLYAEAKPGYVLSGTGSSKTSPVTGTMGTDGVIFEPKPSKEQYYLTLSAEPSTAGTVSGGGTYFYGDTATVQATPGTGYRFASWSDGSAETPHFVTVTSTTNLTARFAAESYGLQLVFNEGVAKIFYQLGGGAASNVTASATLAVPYGTFYRLWAEALPGYTLTGSGSSQGAAVTGTMKADGFVFAPQPAKNTYLVTVQASPTKAGTVKVNGDGRFETGDRASVEANANEGWYFIRWDDVTTATRTTVGTNPTFAFTVERDTFLEAVFSEEAYTVTFVYRLPSGEKYRDEQSVAYGGTAVEPPDEKRNNWPGHAFVQWDSSAWKSVKGDCVINAEYADGAYTVAFDPNGGTGTAMRDQTFTYGQEGTLTKNTYSRAGYTFAGWTLEAGSERVDFEDQARVKDLTTSSSITLYAVWEPITYMIAFDPNGGDGTMEPISCLYDVPRELPANLFEKSGDPFAGWLYNGVIYADKEVVSRLTTKAGSTVTFKAQWGGACQVAFHANYEGAKQEHTFGDTVRQSFLKNVEDALRANPFHRTGYTFAGWSATATGSVKYSDQTLVNGDKAIGDPGDTIDLYAVWTPNTYQVVFDKNDVHETEHEPFTPDAWVMNNCRYDAVVTNSVDATHKNDFCGWSTSTSKSDLVTDSSGVFKSLTSIPNDHIRLYAIWKWTKDGDASDNAPKFAQSVLKTAFLSHATLGEGEGVTDDGWKAEGWTKTWWEEGYTVYSNGVAVATLSRTINTNGTLTFEWMPSAVGDVVTEEYKTIYQKARRSGANLIVKYADTVVELKGSQVTCELNWNSEKFDIENKTTSTTLLFTSTANDDEEGGVYPVMLRNVKWTPAVAPSFEKEVSVVFDIDSTKGTTTSETKQTVTVVTNAAGAVMQPGYVKEEPYVTSKDGWTFTGWYDSVGKTNVAIGAVKQCAITDDTTFTAQFTKQDPGEESYACQVSFAIDGTKGERSGGGATKQTVYAMRRKDTGVVTHAAVANEPTVSCKSGWAFVGWRDEAAGTNIARGAIAYRPITNDTAFTALFKGQSEIVVSFALGDPRQGCRIGGGELEQKYTSETFRALSPTVVGTNGWDFVGWDDGTGKIVSADEIALEERSSDATFTAKFTPHVFTILYANLHGCNPNNQDSFTAVNGVLTVHGEKSTVTGYRYKDATGFDERTYGAFRGWKPSDLLAKDSYQWIEPENFIYTYTNAVTQAQWDSMYPKTNTCTVTFLSGEDWATTNKVTVDKGKSVTDIPDAAERSGYAFTGWDKSLDNVMEDFTTKAQYTLVRYPIVYSNLKGTTHENPSEYDITFVKDGDYPLTAPKNDNTNIRFLGWILDGKPTDCLPQSLADDMRALELEAAWAYLVSYTRTAGDHITAIAGQASATSTRVNAYVGDTIGSTNAPAVACENGYSFAGWKVVEPADEAARSRLTDDEGFLVDAAARRVLEGSVISNVTEKLSLAAVATANVYTVTYEGLGGAENNPANPSTFTVEDTVVFLPPGESATEGELFAGWNPPAIPEGTAGDVTTTATWTQAVYRVTFTSGAHLTPQGTIRYDVDHGASAELPELTPDAGWSLKGWHSGAAISRSLQNKEGSFLTSGEDAASPLGSASSLVAYGVDAEGFLIDAAGRRVYGGTITNVTEALALTAVATANVYTVRFDANGGTGAMADQTFVYDQEQALSSNCFAKTGCTFAGWLSGEADSHPLQNKEGSSSFRSGKDSASPLGSASLLADGQVVKNLATGGVVTLTAQWTINEYPVGIIVGEHFTTPGAKVETVEHGGNVELPTVTPDAGWSLKGWHGGAAISRSLQNKEGSFLTSGEDAASPLGSASSLVAYGVDTEGFLIDAAGDRVLTGTITNVTEALALTAVATANVYSVTYEGLESATNNPANPATFTVTNAVVFLPPGTAEEGRLFAGWDPAGIAEGTTNDVTATATWTQSVYRVTLATGPHFTPQGTVAIDVEHGGSVVLPKVTPDAGWSLAGWDDAAGRRVYEGTVTNITGSLALTAVATANVYTVIYENLCGATNNPANPSTFTVEDPVDFEDPLPRTGYRFDGWTPSGIAKGTTEDVTTTAAWTRVHAVLFQAGGNVTVEGAGTPQIVEDGGSVELPTATPARGYALKGWHSGVAISRSLQNKEGSFLTSGEDAASPLGSASSLVAYEVDPEGFLIDAAGDRVLTGTITNVTESLPLTAVATACVYRITYEGLPEGVTNDPENPAWYTVESADIVFGKPIVPVALKDQIGPFAGWTPSGIVTPEKSLHPTGDVTTVAQWGQTYRVEVKVRVSDREASGVATSSSLVTDVTSASSNGEATSSSLVKDATSASSSAFCEGGSVALYSTNGLAANPGRYVTNTVLTAEATASNGWAFAGWEGADGGQGLTALPTLTFTVTNDVSLTAVFTQQVFVVTVGGVATAYRYGETATCATPASVTNGMTNVVCVGWIGSGSVPASGTSNSVSFVVTQASELTWQYATNYWVSVEAAATANGEATSSSLVRDATSASRDGGRADGGQGLTALPGSVVLYDAARKESSNPDWYRSGTNLVAEATAAEGWLFAGWESGEADSRPLQKEEGSSLFRSGKDSASPLAFAVTSPIALTAVFTQKVFVVSFELDENLRRIGGGALVQTVAYGEAAELPTVEGVGYYALEGWYDADGKRMDAEALRVITASATYFARSVAAVPYIAADVAAEYEPKETIEPIVIRCVHEDDATLKVTGLPSGLSFTTKEKTYTAKVAGMSMKLTAPANSIYGTPSKSGLWSAPVTASVSMKIGGRTVTTVVAETNLAFVIRADGETVVRTEVTLAAVSTADVVPGKTTGQGVYAAGKKVTLKATANKGYVFSGWWRGEAERSSLTSGEDAASPLGSALVSRLASLALVVPDDDVTYEARFVSAADDAASIRASVDGLALFSDEAVTPAGTPWPLDVATNVSVGVYLEWPVAADAASAVTVAVSGLPTGLKFTAKPITQTVTVGGVRTVVTNVPAMTIYGTPTAASKTDRYGEVVPSEVKVTVTTAGKAKAVGVVELTVEALPEALVGTYVGGATGGEEADVASSDGSGLETASPVGSATVTLAKTGKVSGKWICEGKTWTLSAAGFDAVVGGGRGGGQGLTALPADRVFVATVTFKCGKDSETHPLVFFTNDLGYGKVVSGEADSRVDASTLFSATYVPWKTDAELKELAKELKGEKFTVATDDGVTLAGTVGANGVVSVKGTFDVGAARPYTATASGTLVPVDEELESFELFVYYPPVKNKFDGYAVRLVLTWDGEELRP